MATETTDAVHPSRAMKHCTDCKHQWRGGCNHPSLPVCEVTGQPKISCLTAREDGPCGKEATLFAAPLPRPNRVKVMVDGVRIWRDVIEEIDSLSVNPSKHLSEDQAQ